MTEQSEFHLSEEARERFVLIGQIERLRRSKVITYISSDRPNVVGQIADDAVRPMYDHLRAIGPTKKIDLFLHSLGGSTDVPWRIVTMIREFADEFAVLVPYRAMSAATMIALGADEIVMGRKGELGPIDPHTTITRNGEGGTVVQQQVAVEDVMAYIRFVRERVGLTDQAALAAAASALTQQLTPQLLGQLNRAHSHIRDVARKLLTAHGKAKTPDEQRIQLIVEILAERTYQHGHAIGRREAKDIGLTVTHPEKRLEDLMWHLYESYEQVFQLRRPFLPEEHVPEGQRDTSKIALGYGCMESRKRADYAMGELTLRKVRQVPQTLNVNVTVNLQLPPGAIPDQLPADSQQLYQQLMQTLVGQAQQAAQQAAREEAERLLPVVRIESSIKPVRWIPAEDWPGTK